MFESKSDILLNCYWHTRQGRWTVSRETSHGHSHASCMHTLLINSGKSITPRKISSIIILQLTYRAGRKRKFWINRRCENWSSRINLSLSQTKERVQHVGSTADTMERSIFNRVILKWTDPWSWTPAKKNKGNEGLLLRKVRQEKLLNPSSSTLYFSEVNVYPWFVYRTNFLCKFIHWQSQSRRKLVLAQCVLV